MREELVFSVFLQFFDITDTLWLRCIIFFRVLHYFLHLYFHILATDLSYKMKFCSEIFNFPFYDNLKIIISFFHFISFTGTLSAQKCEE